MRYRNLEERIIANSILSEDTSFEGSPCWVWIGKRSNGRAREYGAINFRRGGKHQSRAAHRVTYEELVGPIPEGCHIDHKCGVTLCVNPNHLEAVLCGENIRRRDAKRRAA